MKLILNTFIYLTLFTLGWNLGVAIESGTENFGNVYLLWGLLLLFGSIRYYYRDLREFLMTKK